MDFRVAGEFKVPLKWSNGWIIDRAREDAFWEENGLGDRRGCYVFGIRRGRGIIPIYVGKTERAFRDECFTDGKKQRLHERLGENGSIVLFLIYCLSRGSAQAIGQLESHLIAEAVENRGTLLNIQKNRLPLWTIEGVGSGRTQGRPTREVERFTKMMGIDVRRPRGVST